MVNPARLQPVMTDVALARLESKMFRIAFNLSLMLSVVIAAGAISFAASQPAETVLGDCAVGDSTAQVLVRVAPDGHNFFVMSVGNAVSSQSFNLQTACPLQLAKTQTAQLKVEAVDPADANNVVTGFSVAAADGDIKWVSVWLNKNAGRWSLRGEWIVEKFNHKELGERDESQTFSFDAGGILKRVAKRNNIEGVKTTCAQGCCVVWQTRTLVTEEIEKLSWNPTLRTADRKTFKKWYFAQHGDGLFNIAKKVFGNPQKLTTLIRLNPELQKQETLDDDQKILVEDFTQ